MTLTPPSLLPFSPLRVNPAAGMLTVVLDGAVLGHIEPRHATNATNAIREAKVTGRLRKI